jgi:hypothetical protein
VRSIKHECLDRIGPLGERHFRRALKEFVDHYHREQNHQGLEGFTLETVKLLPLIPVLEMAWAEGGVTPAERKMVVDVAREGSRREARQIGSSRNGWIGDPRKASSGARGV